MATNEPTAPGEPLVSVIVPMYNEEKYIAECIESVLAQTYANWRLTVVNNHSTDRSLEIAEQYARRDARIRVITTPQFYPQLGNFNFAVRQTLPESKYCKMVLGDNWIFPDCLRLMVDVAEQHPSVGIVSGLWITSSSVVTNTLKFPSTFVPGREMGRRQLLSGEDYFGSPTMVMYRSDVVRERNPFFREGAQSADLEACYEILQKWDFSFIHQILSFNRTDNISVSSASRLYGSYAMTQYMQAKRYGSLFFDNQEGSELLRRWQRQYYSFLAERAVAHPEKPFWDFQRAVLRKYDERLDWRLLTRHLLLECSDVIFNPKKTLARMARSFRRSRGAAG